MSCWMWWLVSRPRWWRAWAGTPTPRQQWKCCRPLCARCPTAPVSALPSTAQSVTAAQHSRDTEQPLPLAYCLSHWESTGVYIEPGGMLAEWFFSLHQVDFDLVPHVWGKDLVSAQEQPAPSVPSAGLAVGAVSGHGKGSLYSSEPAVQGAVAVDVWPGHLGATGRAGCCCETPQIAKGQQHGFLRAVIPKFCTAFPNSPKSDPFCPSLPSVLGKSASGWDLWGNCSALSAETWRERETKCSIAVVSSGRMWHEIGTKSPSCLEEYAHWK